MKIHVYGSSTDSSFLETVIYSNTCSRLFIKSVDSLSYLRADRTRNIYDFYSAPDIVFLN